MSLIQACFSCMVEATRWTVIWLLVEPWPAPPPDEVLLTSRTILKSRLCRSDDLCAPPPDEVRWVVVVVLHSLAPLDWLDAEHTEATDRLISTLGARRAVGGMRTEGTGGRSNIQSVCSKASQGTKTGSHTKNTLWRSFQQQRKDFCFQTKLRNFEMFFWTEMVSGMHVLCCCFSRGTEKCNIWTCQSGYFNPRVSASTILGSLMHLGKQRVKH